MKVKAREETVVGLVVFSSVEIGVPLVLKQKGSGDVVVIIIALSHSFGRKQGFGRRNFTRTGFKFKHSEPLGRFS